MDELSAVIFSLGVVILGGLVWAYPAYYVSRSQIVGHNERLFWVLVCVFLSWLGLVFYSLIAPLKPKD